MTMRRLTHLVLVQQPVVARARITTRTVALSPLRFHRTRKIRTEALRDTESSTEERMTGEVGTKRMAPGPGDERRRLVPTWLTGETREQCHPAHRTPMVVVVEGPARQVRKQLMAREQARRAHRLPTVSVFREQVRLARKLRMVADGRLLAQTMRMVVIGDRSGYPIQTVRCGFESIHPFVLEAGRREP